MQENTGNGLSDLEASIPHGGNPDGKAGAPQSEVTGVAGDLVPVVGLGGSAGSLEVLQKFFLKLPPQTGVAFVVVVHLSPEHVSILGEILQRSSPIPVITVSEATRMEGDHVYVIPPGKHLTMADGFIELVELDRPKGRHVAVDLFFRTMAESHGPAATAIVLSGGDGDGALGVKRVKELGGLTIAQLPEEAANDSMPRGAIATGMVDWVLPVEEMPERIMQYLENARKIHLPSESLPLFFETQAPSRNREEDEVALHDILAFLKARTGHDFGSYKSATILRRIGRRMQVNSTVDLDGYRAFLRANPNETNSLLQDLLISVTNFFRDRESFRALEKVIPDLFKGKGPTDHVRVWVPACATGEEAYSVAILLCEHAAKLEQPPQIQVFATDLDRVAIEAAREGRYSATISVDVSEERLLNFFTKTPGSYRVNQAVRELVLFAVHDLLKNSPFSRLDLVCCRNLLIYLSRPAQTRVFDIFHFALRPDGRLFLGSSESAEEASELFEPTDKKHRIYLRRSPHRSGFNVSAGAGRPFINARLVAPACDLPAVPLGLSAGPGGSEMVTKTEPMRHNSWGELHLKLIERLAPPSVVITREYDIVHLSKSAGMYLKYPGGEPTTNLLKMIYPGVRSELRTALFQATQSKAPLRLEGLQIELDDTPRTIDITLESVEDIAPGFLLVMFHNRGEPSSDVPIAKMASTTRPADDGVLQHLEDELHHMKSRLRDTVEQYEASTEELMASNEELQAMNEELRSATEELETGREELQSVNEEVIIVNLELKNRIEELSRTNSDLQNLMASTNIATIFLDRELQITRFTPSTTGLFNFIGSDIGRPLSDFTHRLDYPEISEDAASVLEHLTLVEREVCDFDGRWFLARMLPYRTLDDRIAGVVITCVDISARKSAEEAGRWLSAMVDSSNDAIISFTMDEVIVSWNGGAERMFGYMAEDRIGRTNAVLTPPDRLGEKESLLEELWRGESITQFETVQMRNDGARVDVSFSASVMRDACGKILGATAIMQDISARKAAVEGLRQAKEELEARVEERTAELRRKARQISLMASDLTFTEQRERKRMAHILHDQFQQLLVAVKMRLEALSSLDDSKRGIEIPKLTALMNEVLSNSRSLAVELSPPILTEGLGRALEWLCGTWMKEKHGLTVTCDIDFSVETIHEDMRILLFLAVRELLFNTVKHAQVGEAHLELGTDGADRLRVRVIDRGCGFDINEESLEHALGSGFGLMSLRERLQMLGGTFEIASKPGFGVDALITAPRLI